jgi:molybdopterin/thiamine biosynthesis adenylyltransferase
LTRSTQSIPVVRARRGDPERASVAVALVGIGNTGSNVLDHLARMRLAHLTLIDSGHYEEKDVAGQSIDRRAIGGAKVQCAAERVRRIAPNVAITTIRARVEDVPIGALRGKVILSCLDSKISRAYVNQAARWLGCSWIDAGVEPSQMLARVNVYRAAPDCPCAQCAWSDADYATMERRNPCQAGEGAAPTNAPTSLGALAASIQAIELQKVLGGDWKHSAVGKQVTHCALTHKVYVTALSVNPNCRCDHQGWRIKPLCVSPADFTLGEVLRLARRNTRAESALRVAGKTFVTAVACTHCGVIRRNMLRLEGRLTEAQRHCRRCGGELTPVGFEQLDRLAAADLGSCAGADWASRSLASIGLGKGDVFQLEDNGRAIHYEIRGRSSATG